jgi:hypothetical protein
MGARLYKIMVEIECWYVSEDGTEPHAFDAIDAARDEFNDNTDSGEVQVSLVREAREVPADVRGSLPRGTSDERTIGERAAELFAELSP